MLKLSKIDPVALAQEFHISVTPLGADEYLVRIERVAPGVPLAEERVTWPVEDWLMQARQLMNDPLLGVLEGNAAFLPNSFFLPEWDEPVSQSSRNLVELGQELYNALFQGSLRDSWMMAQAIAQNHRQVLRLRLGLKGTRLPRLPWEVLHGGDRPLATGTDVAFSRYQMGTGLINPVQAFPLGQNQHLKILMVIAGPSDQETLELAQEVSDLQAELRNRYPNEPPAIELTILEQPGREQLTQALEQGQYQVFHYAGHSNLGDSGGDVYLVSNKTGLTETLNGEDLAGLLANNGVQLAVFNSCRGAYTAASDSLNRKERNLAEALVKRGIPGVLAMAERIADEVALTLTRLLYRNLNQGYPIDLSLSRARQGLISAYGSNQLYWALPVLYLHPEFDGFLTNEATHNRAELFVLPDPSDLDYKKEEALFTPPVMPTSPSFPTEDELDPALRPSLPDEYGDEDLPGFLSGLEPDNSDPDDPSDFIKNLLSQLDPTPPSSEPAAPVPLNLELPDLPPNSLPSPPREPAPITPPSVTTPAPIQQPNQPFNQPESLRIQQPPGSKSWWQKFWRVPKLLLGLGATGVVAIALLGVWFFQNRGVDVPLPKPTPTIPVQSPNPNVNLEKADTPTVTNIAIEQFNRGNIAAGQKAVEQLLNREALPQAKAALDAVPKSQLDNPGVSFLRGRLAWQSVKAGSQDYDLSDARRYWETAHKAQPKSSAYLNALGFAYYAEGNFEQANNAWFKALYLMQESQAGAGAAGEPANREALDIFAGLALGLRQSAQKQPADKRSRLLNESLKYRQYVMTKDPVNFQPDALYKNWLWSEKAIKDWRSLLASNN